MSDLASAAPATDEAERRRLDADWFVLGSTVLVVLLVAVAAAYVSYGHAFELIHGHGESKRSAVFGAATVDGLVYASGMMLLQAARHRRKAPGLAIFGLWLGILATISANVAHGWSHGVIGALVSAWPAAALITSYELLMRIIRAGAPKGPGNGLRQDFADEDGCPHRVALTAQEAAVNAWFHHIECLGEDYSQRRLAADLEITNRKKLAQWIGGAAVEPAEAAPEPSLNGSAATS